MDDGQPHRREHADLERRLLSIGLAPAQATMIQSRALDSHIKLTELGNRLRKADTTQAYSDLTIYAAGSYGRGEASPYSDIDLFFIHDDKSGAPVDEPKLKGIRVMSTIIRETEQQMAFPPPSNDGQFLNIMELQAMLAGLGGMEDDYRNYFTGRLLMMLEGRPVYGDDIYERALGEFVDAYLRDYEDHASDFRPTFLVNDIVRFWKTLCLNYENKRNQQDPSKKVRQKIKNFKLGFSRKSTCFATIALLSSFNQVDRAGLLDIFHQSPISRLLTLADRVPGASSMIRQILSDYMWFLELTAKTESDLEDYFRDRERRTDAFSRAGQFGRSLYELLKFVAEQHNTMQHLLI